MQVALIFQTINKEILIYVYDFHSGDFIRMNTITLNAIIAIIYL